MKNFLILLGFVLTVSCEQKQELGNFNDRVLDFAIRNAEDQFIELPDLYPQTVKMPADSEEQFILAEKLKGKGFKVTRQTTGNYSVSGIKVVAISLNKGICDCEVSKTYYPTPYESQYKVTEKVKCRDVSQ